VDVTQWRLVATLFNGTIQEPKKFGSLGVMLAKKKQASI